MRGPPKEALKEALSPEVRPREELADTILEFAAPVLSATPPDAPLATTKLNLSVAITLWNAIIFDEMQKGAHVDQVRRQIHSPSDLGALIFRERELIDVLVARKQRLFSGDQRLVGSWELQPDEKVTFRLRVEPRTSRPTAAE